MPSLLDVYLMTWREFQLRLMAYKRMQRQKHEIARQMTYYSGYALHVQKPKPIDVFWKIGDDNKSVSDEIKEQMKKAMQEAWRKVKKK